MVNGGGRLIPARAGKTRKVPLGASGQAAHPRAGGENASANSGRPAVSGSSPRGRGKLSLAAHLFGIPGLIPARAGKTTHLVHMLQHR